MNQPLTIHCKLRIERKTRGRIRLESGKAPVPVQPGRVPRVSRLMALAIKFDGLVRRGEVPDYAGLARLGHVTRARMTQIMNLLLLAPEIQEQLLFLPNTEHGHDPIHLRQLQPIAQVMDWRKQRTSWKRLICREDC